ncbi:MAG: pilus assembly protein CpaB [Moorella sp. (in: firmicutes)]|nr:pilus assembly protein CpaB [Moorella sp. (in: firmicutes)]
MTLTEKRILVIAAFIALVSAVLLWWGMGQWRQGQQVRVLVAARDVEAFQVIKAEDLAYQTVPASARLPESIQDPAQLVGRMANVKILKGEQILKRKVVESNLALQENERAVAVPVDIVRSAGGYISPGEPVDVYFYDEGINKEKNDAAGATNKGTVTPTPGNNQQLQGLQELPVDKAVRLITTMGQVMDFKKASDPNNKDKQDVVLLKVPESAVPGLIYAINAGKVVLVKRPATTGKTS